MSVVLGVMARAPVAGRCKTRLGRAIGEQAAADLYAAMLRDSLDRYLAAGADRYVLLAAPEDDGVAVLRAFAPAPWEIVAQEGAGLGERLASAMERLGAGGAAVALLDSDSPTLPMAPVAAALAAFRGARRALLGPCHDGGYYLVGLTTPEARVFEDIPWSTAGVLEATRQRCAEIGLALSELPAWYDIDEPEDLLHAREELGATPSLAPRTAAALARLP